MVELEYQNSLGPNVTLGEIIKNQRINYEFYHPKTFVVNIITSAKESRITHGSLLETQRSEIRHALRQVKTLNNHTT